MEMKKGVVKAFNSTAYTATVQLAGSQSVWLYKVPVARNIGSSEMTAGRNCAVVFFDESNRDDAVVVGVYG
ncbi:MAG: hypothetical protein FJ320_12270 [SAR202 cluster bacterium]|nr:hypothetical protein [SAR202 cluster bacterium]